jgi:uncharacterized repeat protein (TIGR03833 family)
MRRLFLPSLLLLLSATNDAFHLSARSKPLFALTPSSSRVPYGDETVCSTASTSTTRLLPVLYARRSRRGSSSTSSDSNQQSDYVKARLGLSTATSKNSRPNSRRRRTSAQPQPEPEQPGRGNYRELVRVGAEVFVVKKEDQRTGVETQGIVMRHLTNSPQHPRGIKVMLTTGQVGRVTRIVDDYAVDNSDSAE